MPPRLLPLAIGGIAAVGVAWAIGDYRAWRALGPGGLPPTWQGWLRTTRWRLAKRNAVSLAPLAARRGGPMDMVSLTALAPRAGSRPRVAPHPVPHRQVSQHAPRSIRPALDAVFVGKVSADPGRLCRATSHFEKNVPAVTLHPAIRHHRDARAACGEVGHVHASDGSMHMILSPSDAATVIERGWGERHGLAGSHLDLPLTYMMIYAPRDEQEVAAISSILDAAIRYQALGPRPARQIISAGG